MTKAERKRLCDSCRAKFPGKTPSLFAKQLKKQRKEKQEQERLTKKGETARIRDAVFKRAEGLCELDTFCWYEPTEMHHLEGGTGRRLQQQAVHNCMAACRWHHRQYHRRPEDYRIAVLAWCERYAYPVPSRFRVAARSAPKALAISSARESR